MEFDNDLIIASFASQYGIRLAHETDITYAEWARLLSGLLPETPLGRVVSIRAETDRKTIERFGKYEKKIRAEWMQFKATQKKQEMAQLDIQQLQVMLKNMFPVKRV